MKSYITDYSTVSLSEKKVPAAETGSHRKRASEAKLCGWLDSSMFRTAVCSVTPIWVPFDSDISNLGSPLTEVTHSLREEDDVATNLLIRVFEAYTLIETKQVAHHVIPRSFLMGILRLRLVETLYLFIAPASSSAGKPLIAIAFICYVKSLS